MAGFVYPRLRYDDAMALLDALPDEGPIEHGYSHPQAVPYEVGTPVTRSTLRAVRDSVLKATEPWGSAGPKPAQVSEWDLAVGRALHSTMEILPADASHDGPWSYLTLVVLPDVAVTRFPDRHSDRMTGKPRNVFRRPWARQRVLGELQVPDGVRSLGEDEMVNIFERSRMARNHALAREIACAILGYGGSDRSAFARRLSVRVRAMTGPLLLEALEQTQLADLVSSAAEASAKPA